MKSSLLTYSAAFALVAAAPALAEDQTPAAPAGTQFAPAPTVQEELVYLRDIIALQTLRLDEAEQTLSRQNALIEAQAAKIDQLEQTVLATRAAQQNLAAAASLQLPGGVYVVKSGDTLGNIARDHNTSISALASANNLSSPYRLSVGQQLTVPGAAPQPTTAPAPQPAQPAQQPQVMAEKIEQPQAQKDSPASQEPQRVAQNTPGPSPEERPDVTNRAVAAQREEEKRRQEAGLPEEVGIRPDEEDEDPYLSIFSDVGGILTPKGSMYIEPSVNYTVTSDNRFFFQGVEIIDAILIGAIEATDSDRRAVTESLGLRYGLTDRLEIDGRFSYINRDDRISGVAIDDATTTLRELSGSGFGDAEVGLHYQITGGRGGFPYLIANARAKAPTGKGPFEVARDPANGVETELATGSGYWTIEPSLTFILPTDPAVIFGNVGYQANLSTSPDAQVGAAIIRETDPGDAIRTSLGVGLSLNEKTSLNFGFDMSQFLASTTLIETTNSSGDTILTTSRQPATAVGAFLFGASYSVNNRITLNLNTAFGATDEAPDMRVSLKAQIRLFD